MTKAAERASLLDRGAEPFTTVRKYRKSDIDRLVALAVEHVPQLPNYQNQKVEPDRLRFVLLHNVNNEGSIMVRVLCDSNDQPVGGIAAYCVMSLISFEYIASDYFLFIHPDWRSMNNVKRLLQAYKEWALARGAVSIEATVTSGERSEAVGRLLRTEGFEEMGKIYRLRK